jgi:hypothetical protein
MRLWRLGYWFLTGACLGLGLVPWAFGIYLLLIGVVLVLVGAFTLRGREAAAAVLGVGAGPAALFASVILQGVPETAPAAQLVYGGVVISSLITVIGLVALVVVWRTPPPDATPRGGEDMESGMASPTPPEPTRGSAPATPTNSSSRSRLALMSLLLSLAPLVGLGLLRLLALGASSLPGALLTLLSVVVYAGSFMGSLGAVLTGTRALRRAQQQPPQEAVRAAAVAGIVLGLLGMVIIVVAAVTIASVLHGCSITPANCG